MELTAAIQGLAALKRPCHVILYTDSEYLKKGINEWLHRWKQRGWKTSDRKPVKNRDLWLALDKLVGRHEVEWRWVKAHAGIPGNERADRLANRGLEASLRASPE